MNSSWLRRRWFRRAVALTLSSAVVLGSDLVQAYQGDSSRIATEDRRSRGTWAALLTGYVAFGALATGGAYLLRDNIFGRGIAVSAAGWGGFGVGAGTAYGLVQLRGCASLECMTEDQVAISVGGLLGTVAGTVVGHLLTAVPGMSRPYTTAAGLTPGLVFLTVGTIIDW